MTVFALIYKETCLLTLQPVYVKLQSVLHRYVLRASAFDESVLTSQQIGFERQCSFRFIIDILHYVAHHFRKSLSYLHTEHMHTCRMRLHYCRMIIHVDDKSGKIITLAMHQTICIVFRISYQSQRYTQVFCHLQLLSPEVTVDFLLRKRKYTHSYTSNLIMSARNEFFFRCKHIYYFTFFGFTLYTGDGSRKHPRMETLKRLFFSGFQINLFICHSG